MKRRTILNTTRSLVMTIVIAPLALAEVDFSRDIRPILSDNCFHCHGPDKHTREADLRLDLREGALRDLDGYAAIVPGNPDKSALIARIETHDADDLMPPEKSNKKLSENDKKLLRQWITEGAEYRAHWGFTSPQRPSTPTVDNPEWVRNPIDAFILQRLQKEGLKPSPEADRATLIRRVALDVTGLPPTIAEIDAFLGDARPDAYERMVDHYLASPRYGEHMARYWLDLARYADSDGYQYDKERTQWPWRDWVIRAYNANMPFDQFTLEQLAGDKLPKPTTDQLIATGFNRNHPITIEGGIIDEEYRIEYAMDRLVTTGQTWMALSFGCARCHDHKFDPISQDEFYRMFDFFNQVADRGMSGFEPTLSVRGPAVREQLANLEKKIAALQEALQPSAADVATWEQQQHAGLKAWQSIPAKTTADGIQIARQDGSITALRVDPMPASAKIQVVDPNLAIVKGRFVRITLPGTEYLSLAEVQVFADGVNVAQGRPARQSSTMAGGTANRAVDGNVDGTHANGSVSHTSADNKPWWEVDLGKVLALESITVYNRIDCCTERLDNFKIEVLDAKRQSVWQRANTPAPKTSVSFAVGGPTSIDLVARRGLLLPKSPITAEANQQIRLLLPTTSPPPKQLAVSTASVWTELTAMTPQHEAVFFKDAAARSAAETEALRTFVRDLSPSRELQRHQIADFVAEREQMAKSNAVKMLVMRDLPKPRKTFFLERGQYDHPKHEVTADVPMALGKMAADLPKNRLGFAKWLVRPDHPLTARVAVNRYWYRLFGTGIVKTLEEFGSQGAWPSHPQLLDWLAVDFVESGWDVKHAFRTMLTSATYRQSSVFAGDSVEADPANRFLARGPRFRLDAEVIRDSALASAGLLKHRLGGPSVYPYQPEGLWMEINNRKGYARAYPKLETDNVYRRSLYTYWKRTLPHPQMQTFDAPNREFCVVYRSRTNTPLQALASLHDPQYVEAARHLAERMLTEGGDTTESRAAYGFRLVTGRQPSAAETATITRMLQQEQERFAQAPEKAARTLAVGLSPRNEKLNPIMHAVWTTFARLLLNLDEAINKG